MGHDEHCRDYCFFERGPVREDIKEIAKAVLEEEFEWKDSNKCVKNLKSEFLEMLCMLFVKKYF